MDTEPVTMEGARHAAETQRRVSRGVSQTARRSRTSRANAGRVGEGVRAFCPDDSQLDRASGARQRCPQRWPDDGGARRTSAFEARGEGSSRGKGDIKKSCRLVRSRDRLGPQGVFELVKANQAQHAVRRMCRLLEVSPSGFYAYV